MNEGRAEYNKTIAPITHQVSTRSRPITQYAYAAEMIATLSQVLEWERGLAHLVCAVPRR